ncbi:MAG: hypothetical protein U0M48_00740 [Xylanibacter rarus]
MKRLLLFSIAIILILCSCNYNNETRQKLVLADTLLYQTKNDSAMEVLKSINAEVLKDESDKAYYNLLMTQTRHVLYMTPMPDSIINGCIEYYTKHYDAEQLAKSYYYKGAILRNKDKIKEAILTLKAGEIHARKSDNKVLLHHIAEQIAFINMKADNLNTALKYEYIALQNSKLTGNKAWILEDMFQMATIFDNKNIDDSCEHYMREALKYTKYLHKKLRSNFYANVSAFYYNTNKIDSAEKYILMSIKAKPTTKANYILGVIYMEKGRKAEAWKLCEKAVADGDFNIKAEVLAWMSDIKKEQGEYKEAMELAERSKAAEDSMKARQQTENMLALQENIEKEEAVKNAGQWMPAAAAAIAALAIIIIAAAVYHRKKMSRARNLMEEDREKIDLYTQQLESMAVSGKDKEKEIKKLKKKIEDIRKHEAETVSRGKMLHKEIADGGTTVKWSKDDFEAFIEYFRIEYAEKAREAESRYGKLTTNSLFALSLITIGFSDKDIQRIMAITPGALRTIKYRLKKQVRIENG